MRSILRAALKAASGIGLAREEGAAPGFTRQGLRHRAVAEAFAVEVPERAATVLDVGCGTGGLSELLHAKGYSRLAGCDWLPSGAVDRAPPDYEYQQVDLNAEGLGAYGDASIDALVCSDVIEHLENPAAMLREFARVLRPGGVAVVSLPNAFNMLERVSWLVTGNSTRYKREQSTSEFGHISVIPANVLNSLAARAGLKVTGRYGGYFYLDGYMVLPGRDLSPRFSYNIIWTLRKPDSAAQPMATP
jgi:2-polyprenyl-6-hydroxyphenyl methylase/3-demethylubiquinone-9 3-methyltransferase